MSWRDYIRKILSDEISNVSKYFDSLVAFPSPSAGAEKLFDSIVAKKTEYEIKPCDQEDRKLFLFYANFNHENDIQNELLGLHQIINRHSRVMAVLYNPYLKWMYSLANKFGIRQGEEPTTFVTETDLINLAKISGYEVTSLRTAIYCPWRLFGIGDLINKVMPVIPVLRWMSLVVLVALTPIKKLSNCSLSIIIPARNEKGNIENAVKRISKVAEKQEIIFVEGNSSDGTLEEIERVVNQYKDKIDISFYKQQGKGKADAVRLGFSKAKNDLLVILDADLTMPPELLNRFYDAYVDGHGSFINGSRLVYPMEGEAMRFLNKLGNIFFAKALSFVLGTRIGDSLCGTQLIAKRDYQRVVEWRNDFGDFDPFGDFELLFPAAILGLGIVDIPIRYRDRTYGSTNISRWKHGAMLLRMTLIGLLRIKTGRINSRLVARICG